MATTCATLVADLTDASRRWQQQGSFAVPDSAVAQLHGNGGGGGISSNGAQIQRHRELAAAQRKVLAETAKNFKKMAKSIESSCIGHDAVDALEVQELMNQGKLTIRQFQEEIDTLTKRCKWMEQQYSALVTTLQDELPFPGSLLLEAAQQLQQQQLRIQQLEQQPPVPVRVAANTCDGDGTVATDTTLGSPPPAVEPIAITTAVEASTSVASNAPSLSRAEREELGKLRREVAEYEVEFRSLKNQDITIRKLEQRIAELQTVGVEQFADQLAAATQELQATEGRRVAAALAREAAMESRVQSLELQLRAERAGRDAAQVQALDHDDDVGRREAAWEAQRELLVADAERVRHELRICTQQRDDYHLRWELLAVSSGGNPSGAAMSGSGSMGGRTSSGRDFASPPSSLGVFSTRGGGPSMSPADVLLERKAYEAEVTELSETVTALRDELQQNVAAMSLEKRSLLSKVEVLEREQISLRQQLSTAETQLAAAPQPELVECMRRELRVLKRLEYNHADDDDDDADRHQDPEIAGTTAGEPDLESVLISKLRRAESELVGERFSRSESAEKCRALEKELVTANQARVQAEQLVRALEKDLEQAISSPNVGALSKKDPLSSASSDSFLASISADAAAATLQSVLDPTAALIVSSRPARALESSVSSNSATALEKANDDHSVATIIMAQRDRLRARCDALEAERDSFKQELQIQVQASESFKSDNTKLYEKVRYLQNYNKMGATGRTSTASAAGAYSRNNTTVDRDIDLEALEQRYEASVDPFRQFSKSERQRKLSEMSPTERTVFVVAKTVLSTKEMRTGLFFYVLAMHLLVFITTYHWSHTEGCNRIDHDHLSHLPPVLPMHVQERLIAQAQANTVSAVTPGGSA